MCNCLAQAEQYCSIKSISMYHTFLWLCKCGDEKLANSTVAEILAGVYLPLSPVASNISPNQGVVTSVPSVETLMTEIKI